MDAAGLVLIEDDEIKLRLPKRWGIDDVPVIIQDKRATPPMMQIDYQLDIMTAAVGWFGDTLLTNGAICPQHSAPKAGYVCAC